MNSFRSPPSRVPRLTSRRMRGPHRGYRDGARCDTGSVSPRNRTNASAAKARPSQLCSLSLVIPPPRTWSCALRLSQPRRQARRAARGAGSLLQSDQLGQVERSRQMIHTGWIVRAQPFRGGTGPHPCPFDYLETPDSKDPPQPWVPSRFLVIVFLCRRSPPTTAKDHGRIPPPLQLSLSA